MNIKIGYQVLVGSNSEEAAKAFKVNLGLPDADGCHSKAVGMLCWHCLMRK